MADPSDSPPPSDPPDSSGAPPSSEPPSSSDPAPDSEPEKPENESAEELEPEDEESGPESQAPPGPPPKKPSKPTPGGRDLPPPKSERSPSDYPQPTSQLPPRKFPPETVADIMTRKVFVVHEDDQLTNIEDTMQRFRFRHLPVVDKKRKILGVMSHRDILRSSASSLSEMTEARNEFIQKHAKVAAIMNRDVVTVPPDEPVRAVGKRMRRKGIGCVLVEDEDEMLLGIVTEADYLDLAVALLKPEE
ncbi:MAG: CBS domain-containing protein [Deltaproteobacteria bacterium]|nr:CBS domain-containing protein [Deltaproteobacteria bacterium]